MSIDRGAHDAGKVCVCVSDHHPDYLELEKDHVWETQHGGPDEPWNFEWLCPTAHTNKTELMRLFMKSGRLLSFHEVGRLYTQTVARWPYEVARVGYMRWRASIEGRDPKLIKLEKRR